MSKTSKSLNEALKEKALSMGNSLPLMKGREKADLARLIDTTVTIREYGFMNDGDGEDYVAFVVDEDPDHFYFGGMVLTNHMHSFDEDGFHEAIVADGLPTEFGKKASKNKNAKGGALTYTTVKFYPEA